MSDRAPPPQRWLLLMPRRCAGDTPLMSPMLERCDGLPAYLASSGIYERHGFEAISTMQAGNSPPLYSMYRQPGAPQA